MNGSNAAAKPPHSLSRAPRTFSIAVEPDASAAIDEPCSAGPQDLSGNSTALTLTKHHFIACIDWRQEKKKPKKAEWRTLMKSQRLVSKGSRKSSPLRRVNPSRTSS